MNSYLFVTYDNSLIQSTIGNLRKQLADSNFIQKNPEQIEKELEKLFANFKTISENSHKPQIKKEIKLADDRLIKRTDNENRIQKIQKYCAKEEKIMKELYKNLRPQSIDNYYEANRKYENCLEHARNAQK